MDEDRPSDGNFNGKGIDYSVYFGRRTPHNIENYERTRTTSLHSKIFHLIKPRTFSFVKYTPIRILKQKLPKPPKQTRN